MALPIDPYEKFVNFEKESKFNNRYYKEAIGSLIFLSMVTRPDISYSVGVLSRYAENPTKAHWNGVKRIIKYIKGTLNHGLIFGRCRKENGINILAFSDADFAGDSETRRSTSGCLIKLGSDLITWSSRKQPTVALSTTESEFIAACNAAQEIIWLNRLIKDLIGKDLCDSTLFIDNQSTIKIIKNPQFHCRTKHIDIKYNFVREKFNAGLYKLKYVCSAEQEADIFTKGLSKQTFEKFKNVIGIFKEVDF